MRNAAVFIAVVLALSLIRFFHDILSPLVVAAFLLVLVDGASRQMQRRLPRVPHWLRGVLAGAIVLAAFGLVGGVTVIEAPPFAQQIRTLAPKLDVLLLRTLAAVGAPGVTIEQMFSGSDPGRLAARAFGATRGLITYGALVIIYFGFLVASRATFTRKIDQLYDTEAHRRSALRVTSSVGHAVERYAWLQTLKALLVGSAAWGLMKAMGVNDALFVAFLVFVSAFVPIVGGVIGSIFPGLLALAQFNDITRPLVLVGVLGGAVFVIDNVVMPKLQGDQLNLDPLFILVSLGFWAAIFGGPGVLLATPLTVTVMAIAAEFSGTRWLAILLSRDGHPGGGL